MNNTKKYKLSFVAPHKRPSSLHYSFFEKFAESTFEKTNIIIVLAFILLILIPKV